MASAVFFTAARMKQIEDSTVVSGAVDSGGNLVLKTRDGTLAPAGSVVGPKGDKGDTGAGVTFVAGIILAFAGSTPPTGFLICNGAAVSRSTYSALFSAIGTRYGAGNGSTTFNLPDLRGRQLVGLDASQTEFDTLGKMGGHKEMQRHSHLLSPSGSGSHSYAWGNAGDVNIANAVAQGGASNNNRLYTQQGVWDKTQEAGRPATEAANNLDPYTVAQYVISIGTVTAPGGDPVKAQYLLRGSTAERDAIFGIPGSNGDSIALAQKQILWYNTDLGWEEMYFERHGLAGLGVPGVFDRPPGWYPFNSGQYRVVPTGLVGADADGMGTVVPLGNSNQINLDRIFSHRFRKYRVTGRLRTNGGGTMLLQFLDGVTGELVTNNTYFQSQSWSHATSSPFVYGGSTSPVNTPAIGFSSGTGTLGHTFDMTIMDPFVDGHTHVTGTFGLYGGNVGSGHFAGGIEVDRSFRGIRITSSDGRLFETKNSELTVYGLV